MDVHQFDGKIKEVWSKADKKDVKPFKQVLEEIKLISGPEEKKNLDLLLDSNSNYDSTNEIRVEDILPVVWKQVQHYDRSALSIFLEQIRDISSGSCPQGRVIRFAQFL